MLAALMFVATLNANWSDSELRARIKASPSDIATFVRRRIGWNYWQGESDPANNIPEREQQIQKALRPLRCKSIEREERRLQRKYRLNEQLIRLLHEAHDFLP